MMARDSSLRSVDPTTLADQVYEILRDSILRQELPPGERLELDELQDRLGVSRTPVKEALKQLATERLVEIVPRRGTYVAELSAQEIAERFDVRQILELGAAERVVAGLSEADLEHIQQLHSEMLDLVEPNGGISDYFRYLDLDVEFHRAILRIAGNNQLVETYDELNLKLQMAKVFYLDRNKRVDVVNGEHSRILQALETRDVDTLKEAIRDHVQGSKEFVVPRVEVQARADGRVES
jgi:DNA-binding GntR family transcriptional regulator